MNGWLIGGIIEESNFHPMGYGQVTSIVPNFGMITGGAVGVGCMTDGIRSLVGTIGTPKGIITMGVITFEVHP
jgi:hypothetical protein